MKRHLVTLALVLVVGLILFLTEGKTHMGPGMMGPGMMGGGMMGPKAVTEVHTVPIVEATWDRVEVTVWVLE